MGWLMFFYGKDSKEEEEEERETASVPLISQTESSRQECPIKLQSHSSADVLLLICEGLSLLPPHTLYKEGEEIPSSERENRWPNSPHMCQSQFHPLRQGKESGVAHSFLPPKPCQLNCFGGLGGPNYEINLSGHCYSNHSLTRILIISS